MYKKVGEWEDIGILSFARFYDLTMEEVITMINNPDKNLYAMMAELKQSMMRYETFVMKDRKLDEEGKELTRSDILDFSNG